ncbi:MAG: hypothetical protein N3D80_13430, partial [Ignavibacterium album]
MKFSISKMFFKAVMILLLFLLIDLTKAQPDREITKFKIGLTARSYGDSIYLRWAVTNPTAWKLAKENGFIIERAKVLPDGRIENYSKVSEAPVKPWPI